MFRQIKYITNMSTLNKVTGCELHASVSSERIVAIVI